VAAGEDTGRQWLWVCLAMFAVAWGANQFASMLLVYRDEIGLSAQTRTALFGIYAAGLIPGLLIGGRAADRWGRRALVVPAVLASPLITLVLIAGQHTPVLLAVARLLSGACSGVAFAGGAAWVQELTAHADPGLAARRTTIALSAGFGAGPFATAVVATVAPHPLWVPYLPHLVLAIVAIVLVLRARDVGVPRRPGGSLLALPSAVRQPRFWWILVPLGPWSFGMALVSVVSLPDEISAGGSAVLGAGIAAALTLGAGASIQPHARRWEDLRPLICGPAGLALGVVCLGVGAIAIAADARVIALAIAPVFGIAYGLSLVSGLREAERLARPDERAATGAVYLALTYLGFAVPFAISVLSDAFGIYEALAVVAAAVALSALATLRGSRLPAPAAAGPASP
jgi:MFS family permease